MRHIPTFMGAINDVFACTGNQASSKLCMWADDENWGRIVVQKRTAVSSRVISTWSYSYYLRTGLPGHPCSGYTQGWSWGNQNDNDYADYTSSW